jgi:t-SNARE complex subunit (syntaxin)
MAKPTAMERMEGIYKDVVKDLRERCTSLETKLETQRENLEAEFQSQRQDLETKLQTQRKDAEKSKIELARAQTFLACLSK